MKTNFLCIVTCLLAALSACTKLNSGDSFNQTVGGIEYNFEVIVSKMTYVRLSPVSGPGIVKGDITLPSKAEYEGVTYLVTQIGARAFKDYKGITSVVLPKTVSTIEEEAFAGCSSLTSIDTPQTVAVIGARAFDGCSSLTAFSLQASISELGEGAFRGCSSLAELAFTPTFSAIPAELCLGCTSLGYIDLPSTVMTVGASAFEGCVSAKYIDMESSVQTIGDRAFYGCSGVMSITTTTATPPVCTDGTFDLINPNIPVTVPMASVANYQSAAGWRYFVNISGKY